MVLREIFERVGSEMHAGPLEVSFFPYSELKHTWRTRNGVLRIRVSDYLDDSSDEVLESLAWHLLSKALSRRCADRRSEEYLRCIRSRDMWQSKRRDYLERARNLSLCPAGESRNLAVAFEYVNVFYFGGSFASPLLVWSRESPQTRIGFYFEPLDLMAINKVLDSDSVPRYVLEFVIYHELLHSVVRPVQTDRRRTCHGSDFRKREREFLMFGEAKDWLRKVVGDSRKTKEGWKVSPRCNSAVHGMREAHSPP